MLQNRLNVVLAERRLKANRVAVETGIARSTLSSLINNRSKMIQMDTLNTLCSFLKIDPGSFFEFSPFDFEFSVELNEGHYEQGAHNEGEHWWREFTDFKGDLFITVFQNLQKKQVFELTFSCSDVRWEGVDDFYDRQQTMTIDVSDNSTSDFANFWEENKLKDFFPTFVWETRDAFAEQLLKTMNNSAKEELNASITEADVVFKLGKLPISRY
ncbi:helix-turn-helix domain-containing protein [Lacticaseibacillus rhamnosus]